MELNLKGKKALITGGSKGIGLAIKTALENEGVECISWSRTEGVDLTNFDGKLPEIDILINNIGGLGRCTERDATLCMNMNYGITRMLTDAFVRQLNSWGRVITISSIYGKESGGRPWFNMAKAAEISLMKNLAGKYDGITFNTIAPGHIDVNNGRYEGDGKPKDVANIVVFLCSDKARYVNGSCIAVDGGESKSF